MSDPGVPATSPPPKHTLRNAVILGAFISSVITDVLEASGALPHVNFVVLLLYTLAGYGVLVAVAVTVRYLITGKSVHQ